MKLKFLTILLLSVFSATTIYADETTSVANPNQADEEVLGTLVVLNKNEIAAANAVESKNVSPEVKQFAEMMTKEHGENLQAALNLATKIGKPIENEQAQTMANQGKAQISNLRTLDNKQLQDTYINTMVTDHQAALSTIDTALQTVNNPELKKLLEATRTHVEHHLGVAKQLQEQLKTNS
jgi:putative membrane protein